jgi:hypothetical protein
MISALETISSPQARRSPTSNPYDLARACGRHYVDRAEYRLPAIIWAWTLPLRVPHTHPCRRAVPARTSLISGLRENLDHESFAFDVLFAGASESSYPQKLGADAWFGFHGVDRFEVQE